MKKIISAFILFTAAFAMAQESNTIQIIQRVKHIDSNPNYYCSIVISPYYSNYGNTNIPTKKLIEGFEEALQKTTIPRSEVKEDKPGFLALGLNKEGKLYHFETKIADNFYKFAQLNALGSSRMNYAYISHIKPEEEGEIMAKEIQKARKRAEEIAKQLGNKIGEVISVSSTYAGDAIPRTIFRDTVIGELIFDITVQFEIIN